jgi:hypothetical protein
MLYSAALSASFASPVGAQDDFNQLGSGYNNVPLNFTGQPAWQGQYPGNVNGNWATPQFNNMPMNAAPMTGMPVGGGMPMTGMPMQTGANFSTMQGGGYGYGQPGGFAPASAGGFPPASAGGVAPPNLLRMFFGGQQQAPAMQAPAQQNPFTPQNLLRTFLGGSPSGGTGFSSEASGNAQSNLQVALDQAAQAEDACSRASNGQKDMRSSAAEEAQNHANAARAAADRAASATAGQSQTAQDYAAQARDAANRAQAAADRARYNASTGY